MKTYIRNLKGLLGKYVFEFLIVRKRNKTAIQPDEIDKETDYKTTEKKYSERELKVINNIQEMLKQNYEFNRRIFKYIGSDVQLDVLGIKPPENQSETQRENKTVIINCLGMGSRYQETNLLEGAIDDVKRSNAEVLLVNYRGSNTNIEHLPSDLSPRGIAKTKDDLIEDAEKLVKHYLDDDYNVILKGYCFGGAIAIEAASRIHEEKYRNSKRLFVYADRSFSSMSETIAGYVSAFVESKRMSYISNVLSKMAYLVSRLILGLSGADLNPGVSVSKIPDENFNYINFGEWDGVIHENASIYNVMKKKELSEGKEDESKQHIFKVKSGVSNEKEKNIPPHFINQNKLVSSEDENMTASDYFNNYFVDIKRKVHICEPKKPVVFFHYPLHGHVNPTLGLLKELVEREAKEGRKVICFSTSEFKEKIEKTGAVFERYGGEEHGNEIDRIYKAFSSSVEDASKYARDYTKAIKILIPRLIEQVKEMDPEYTINDSACIWGNYVSKYLKIPRICSSTIVALSEKNADKMVKGTVNLSITNFYWKIPALIRDMTGFVKLSSWLKSKYGIALTLKDTVLNYGDMNIVYTSEEFQPKREKFDETFKFIGPSVIDRDEKDRWEEISKKLDAKRKTIYISMGTLFNNSEKFYKECFGAFKDKDVNVIMSIGKTTDISILGEIPNNFTVANYVPQLEVLKDVSEKGGLFITHGGMNSVSEGLYYGVPLIVVPQGFDQPMVANRVEELGSGIKIKKDKASKETLLQAYENILNNEAYMYNSKKIGESLRNAGGYKKAVDEIYSFKEKFTKKVSVIDISRKYDRVIGQVDKGLEPQKLPEVEKSEVRISMGECHQLG